MAICDSDEADREAIGDVLKLFPGLIAVDHELTSPPSWRYNCIAFALGEDDCNWWPERKGGNSHDLIYWPRRLPRVMKLEIFQKLFEWKGFTVCTDASLENGFEKIALYCDATGKPTHAARQITTGPHAGQWKSKIGKLADIRHETLSALEGAEYGKVCVCFSRKIVS